jgi:hypothetical protein
VLLALPEISNGHAGVLVAEKVIDTLNHYGIKEKLGYITGNNHSANDTICECISEDIEGWDPIEHRLHCFGHIINLAVEAFLFAKDKEAIEFAI